MRVLLDAVNTSLAEGTGIASYARAVARAVNDGGGRTTLLTGVHFPPIGRRRRPPPSTLDAVKLLDHPKAHKPAGRSLKNRRGIDPWYVRNWLYSARSLANSLRWRSRSGLLIEDFGLIESNVLQERYGQFARIFNIPGLFFDAERTFDASGRFLTIPTPPGEDLVHFTMPLAIRADGLKTVVTIHDLIPLGIPFATLDDKAYFHDLVVASTLSADLVVTPSEYSRARLIRVVPGCEPKIVNASLAYDIPDSVLERSRIEGMAREPPGFDLTDRQYLMIVGAIEPRKNIARTIVAYLASKADIPLLLCGPETALSAAELQGLPVQRYQRAALGRGVFQMGFLERGVLLDLMRSARAVLVPSLLEGFGLSAVEALALGTPVVAARSGALPETCGSAAIYVDPHDPRSIRDGIDEALVLGSSKLATIVTAGRQQAAKFSPERFSSSLASLYAQVLSNGNNA